MSELSAEQQEARPILQLEAKSRDTLTRTRAKYFLAALNALEAAERERVEAYGRVADHMVARREAELRVEDAVTERDEAQDEADRLREALHQEHLAVVSSVVAGGGPSAKVHLAAVQQKVYARSGCPKWARLDGAR